jgi:DNA-repair protein XRCC1
VVCLEDAVRSLEENQALSKVMDSWAFAPRAVRELADFESSGGAIKEQLVAEGERLKVLYESQLKKLGFGLSAPSNESTVTRSTKGVDAGHDDVVEKDVDDDATEIISDTDSRDPADFDTDDTEELDEDEVAICKKKILSTFRLD